MFGKAKKERAELREALVVLKNRLDAMQRELSALKEDVAVLRERPPEEKDPDAMSEGEMLNKWYMGEKGDGF